MNKFLLQLVCFPRLILHHKKKQCKKGQNSGQIYIENILELKSDQIKNI